jgi:hypothetical protein
MKRKKQNGESIILGQVDPLEIKSVKSVKTDRGKEYHL